MKFCILIFSFLTLHVCCHGVGGHIPPAHYNPNNVASLSAHAQTFNNAKMRGVPNEKAAIFTSSVLIGSATFSASSWFLFSDKSEKMWGLLPFKIYERYQHWKKPYGQKNWFKTAEFLVKSIFAVSPVILTCFVTYKILNKNPV